MKLSDDARKARNREYGVKYRSKHRERTRKNARKYVYKSYGLTLASYKELVKEQDGKCALCSREPELLVVDHDHETGKLRGLLCNKCNIGIGFLGDDTDGLQRAIRYLEKQASAVR